jgi:protein SCO1/2
MFKLITLAKVLIFSFLVVFSTSLFSAEPIPSELKGVDVKEHVGQYLPLDLTLTNADGKIVVLKDLLKKTPVILSFVYYNCPMLCHFITDGLSASIRQSDLHLGKDYQVISVSFDPNDTTEAAKKFQDRYRELAKDAAGDWSFLTASPDVIKALTSAAGFEYRYDPATKEYMHGAVVLVISPTGKISRYLYGLNWTPFDFKLSITEAKHESERSTMERVMLYCYNYDSDSRGYVLYARNLMRITGAATVFVIIGIFTYFIIQERKKRLK